jgi:integrase
MKVDLRGIAKVRAKGHTYYYAWRGGPRLAGEPGSPEFVASYNEAVAERNAPDVSRFRGVVTAYKASPDWQNLSVATRKNWGPWLDRISDHFGNLSIAQFDRLQKIRPIIGKWHYQWADRPRTADLAMQVLSRVLSFAVVPLYKLDRNPCEGMKRLYKGSDRADIIWTDDDIAALRKVAPAEVMLAVEFAALTGLRLSDVARVSWSHVGPHEIRFATGKSRGKREAVIPIYPALRELLSRIDKRATTLLTNGKHRPWTAKRLDEAFREAKTAAGIDKHFHDLRGTGATKFYVAGFETRVLAEMLGWSEKHVERIIRKYVGRSAATEAAIRRLSREQ